jgi:hypothetical protein
MVLPGSSLESDQAFSDGYNADFAYTCILCLMPHDNKFRERSRESRIETSYTPVLHNTS